MHAIRFDRVHTGKCANISRFHPTSNCLNFWLWYYSLLYFALSAFCLRAVSPVTWWVSDLHVRRTGMGRYYELWEARVKSVDCCFLWHIQINMLTMARFFIQLLNARLVSVTEVWFILYIALNWYQTDIHCVLKK